MRLTAIVLTAAMALPALAQFQDNQERTLRCKEDNRNGEERLQRYCEIKESILPAVSRISVNPAKNGGIAIKGWGRSEILVRAEVDTGAPTEAEAKAMAGQINYAGNGGQIHASGPSFGENRWWGVSYEIFVPHRTGLALNTVNGGISISDVEGEIQFETTNGGVSLKRLAGDVKGLTKNGGLNIELMGNQWQGRELDTRTSNGGIVVTVPENYNARLETSTVNGNIRMEVPVMVSGKIGKQITANLGNGGPIIRAVTTNGGIVVKRKS